MTYQDLIDKLIKKGMNKEDAINQLIEDSSLLVYGSFKVCFKYKISKKDAKNIGKEILSLPKYKNKNIDLHQSYFIKEQKNKKGIVKVKNAFKIFITWLFSSFSLLAVLAIFIFVFQKGWSTLSWDMITGDYYPQVSTFKTEDNYINNLTYEYEYETKENEYFSKYWGIAFIDDKDNVGNEIVSVSYIDINSPFNTNIVDTSNNKVKLTVNGSINSAFVYLNDGSFIALGPKSSQKPSDITSNAKWYAQTFDKTTMIFDGTMYIGGQGIFGSLITTLYTIFFSLLVALPIGVGGAIYLAYYAKDGRLKSIIMTFIDLLSGIPSIIFGLIGALIFIPMFSNDGTTGSILSGAFTLAIMVLPIICKNTKEAISSVDKRLIEASYGLGASQTQTLFKVVLPNSITGIFTGSILSIGRIIGESASLIYAVGTTIQDNVILNQPATTLATHIWSLMAGDNPNYSAACAISIIILFIILFLNILLLIIDHFVNKSSYKLGSKFLKKIKKFFERRKLNG